MVPPMKGGEFHGNAFPSDRRSGCRSRCKLVLHLQVAGQAF